MPTSLPRNLLLLGVLSLGLWGCSQSSSGGTSTGGTTSAGGAGARGGSGGGSGGATGTGGNSATGGTLASGGSAASGGTKGSGGVQETGGTVGTGGSNSGGTKATGGTSTGGAATGGSSTGGSASGGSATGGSATGGSASGGSATGGSATGGSAKDGSASGGSASDGAVSDGAGGSQGKSSPGCGTASPLKTGNFTETIDGTSRKWMLDVPTGYDGTKPYRLIFVWHPLGGSGSQIVSGGFNGLKSLANNTAVFATADGLNGSNSEASGTGWWNANGGDMKLVQAMLDKINGGLCIDQDRIFTTGFSFGGMMSYTLPFEFDVFRATAPCSGKDGVITYNKKFTGPIPIMAFHGDSDTFVLTSLGKAFFDQYAARNKCGTQTQAVSPNGCVQYQGCLMSSTWCLFPGAHTTWSEEPAAIWKFFSQF